MRVYSALFPNDGGIPLEGEDIVVRSPDELVAGDAVLIIWGGEDISPKLYGEEPGRHTGADSIPSKRDIAEWNLADRAAKLGIPIIGICRGAQMMCAMAGGKLVQHVTGHAGFGGHLMVTDDGRTIRTNSLHHQMMFPWNIEHRLIAWSAPPQSQVYLGENDRPIAEALEHPEPEVVYFPTIRALAIQGHPEFISDRSDPFLQYSMELVNGYCCPQS